MTNAASTIRLSPTASTAPNLRFPVVIRPYNTRNAATCPGVYCSFAPRTKVVPNAPARTPAVADAGARRRIATGPHASTSMRTSTGHGTPGTMGSEIRKTTNNRPAAAPSSTAECSRVHPLRFRTEPA